MFVVVMGLTIIAWMLVPVAILGYVNASTLPGDVGFVMHAIVIGEGLLCGYLEDRNQTKKGSVAKKLLAAVWLFVLGNFVISAFLQYGALIDSWKGRIIAGLWIGVTITCAIIFTEMLRYHRKH